MNIIKYYNMSLQEKLDILKEQYSLMLKHNAVCKSIGSIIDYTSLDYDREGELLRKIGETKDLINQSNLTSHKINN